MDTEAGQVKEWPERKAYFGWYLPRGEPG